MVNERKSYFKDPNYGKKVHENGKKCADFRELNLT